MKKITKSLLLILLAFVSVQVLALEYTSLQKRGSSGADTELLQLELTKKGVYSSEVDGIFGSLTHVAVEKFQRLFGLEADGVAGPKTYEAFSQKVKPLNFLGEYTLEDEVYGTKVAVTIDDSFRTMIANGLPNHETGEFPNEGNPNTVSPQDLNYIFPLHPKWVGNAVWVKEPGVAINGLKFEPETAEQISCISGETYRIEAQQDLVNLGLDFNNAHVQPDGAYHYHGVSNSLINSAKVEGSSELIHVGFAMDGYLIYYSGGGDYASGYQLSGVERSGTSCTYTQGSDKVLEVDIEGTIPDGTYVSDWEYKEGSGFLDECNGMTIDGEYVYLITDEYPFVGRCLNGEIPQQEDVMSNDPPVEAVVACNILNEQDSCSFIALHGLVLGSCNIIKDTLACIPEKTR